MNLSIYQKEAIDHYKSNAQIARILTESWVSKNMFCPRCLNPNIRPFPNNNPVIDFSCSNCKEEYQLKSQKANFGKKITDGAYRAMAESINNNLRPNFLFLQYRTDYLIKNLFLVPSFFFTLELIERRNPLSESAKRAGWIGCNILLNKIPPEGKIPIIYDGTILRKVDIAKSWRKIEFMKKSPLAERGWTIEVLNAVHNLNKKEFGLQDIYQYEEKLKTLHPSNSHIRDKIRQQLQILRDKGLLIFLGNGKYKMK
jgi:type II restriction enzyme